MTQGRAPAIPAAAAEEVEVGAATTPMTSATVLRIYRIPFSTNVERVALALGHKGLAAEWVDVDPADRGEVVRVSGQERVPVLEHGGRVISDSAAILEHLEDQFPQRPLLPAEPARRAEVRVFCDWFNKVWKRPPNLIVAEEALAADATRIAALGDEIRRSRRVFEELLTDRDYVYGELSLADVTAFPFLKYAVLWQEGDPDRFHEVLREWLRGDGDTPHLDAWIRRMARLPRA
jgi:glutathione S-transferase